MVEGGITLVKYLLFLANFGIWVISCSRSKFIIFFVDPWNDDGCGGWGSADAVYGPLRYTGDSVVCDAASFDCVGNYLHNRRLLGMLRCNPRKLLLDRILRRFTFGYFISRIFWNYICIQFP